MVKPAFFNSGPMLCRIALPSTSSAHMTPTLSFVFTFPSCQRALHVELISLVPKKKWYVYVKGLSGVAPRPKYHDSHGTAVDRHGILAFSQTSATGLTVSGVDVHSIRSTRCFWTSSAAISAATCGLDW